jgi:hypothetical protein
MLFAVRVPASFGILSGASNQQVSGIVHYLDVSSNIQWMYKAADVMCFHRKAPATRPSK